MSKHPQNLFLNERAHLGLSNELLFESGSEKLTENERGFAILIISRSVLFYNSKRSAPKVADGCGNDRAHLGLSNELIISSNGAKLAELEWFSCYFFGDYFSTIYVDFRVFFIT